MQAMGNKRKMVVLDGDRKTLHDVCTVAKVWYDVLPASDPRKALAWLRNEQGVSIFVTEHVDQSFDGMSLLEKVRTMHPEIQRVVMTTYSDLARLVVGLHSGAIQKLVQKPIDRVEFLTAVAPTEAHAAAVLHAANAPARIARAG